MRRVLICCAAGAATAVLPMGASADAAGFGARYEMSESAGASVLHDSSGHGNSGKIPAGVHPGGGVLRFTGGPPVTIPSSGSLNPGKADFTFSARVKKTGGYANPNIVQKSRFGEPGGQYKLDYWHGWAFCKFIGTNQTKSVRIKVNLNDGRWHVLKCTKRATSISISKDAGTAKAGSRHEYAKIGSIYSTRQLTIGGKKPCKLGDCDHFTGYIDWVRISLA